MIEGELFRVFGLPVTGYGLSLTLGGAIAVILIALVAKRDGLEQKPVQVFAMLAIPLGLLAARLGYCLVRVYFWVEDVGLGWFFRFWEGGYVLYGAVLGAMLAALITAKLCRVSFARLTDAAAPAAMLLVAISRFAEGLIGQGLGWEIENEALAFFPLGVYSQSQDWWFWSLFLLEGLCALGLSLYLLKKPKQNAPAGDRSLMALLCYAAMQLTLESIRTNGVLKWGMVRVSQLLSAIAVAAALLVYMRWLKDSGGFKTACAVGVAACFGGIMIMEFAIEEKIAVLTRLFRAVGLGGYEQTPLRLLCLYGGMAICSALCIFIVTRVRKRALEQSK